MSNAPATVSAPTTWESLIFSERSVTDVWTTIFAKLGEIAQSTANPSLLHRETIVPDRLIAESAWELWQSFPTTAPKAVDALRDFWSAPSSTTGSAVLILDALSLRELSLILAAGQKRGVKPISFTVRASEVPTETNRFATALGLSGRSRLSNNQPPQSFIFGGQDVYTDVFDSPFADCIARIPAKPRLFIWHEWPDSPLIHDQAEATDGDTIVATEIKKTLLSDDFWNFVNTLRQGRRLLITGDHGYASACEFSSDFLGDATLRALAVEGQQRFWQHIADADRPKRSMSKHKGSDYLLSGILHAKQDDGGLVGVLCGSVGKKTRYYRHRRGRTGYLKGSSYNKLIHAETVEKAVVDAVRMTLGDTANLREKSLKQIAADASANVAVDLTELTAQREKLKMRTQLIIASFDKETLADAQAEIEKLKAQRRQLDEQIAAANAAKQTPKMDAETAVERLLGKIENFLGTMDSLPNHLLKEWLAAVVSSVVVDMETKAIEIHVALPMAMLKSAFSSENPMRLATTSASPSDCETHQSAGKWLAVIDCQFQKASNHICYDCQRRVAA